MALKDRVTGSKRTTCLFLGSAVALTCLAVYAYFWGSSFEHYRLRISAGSKRGTRNQIAEYFVAESRQNRMDLDIVETAGSVDALRRIATGEIDLALVQGGLALSENSDVRELAALYVEPLHLLVRSEWFDAVSQDLSALRGKRINVSRAGSGTNMLSQRVLEFAGLTSASADDEAPYTELHFGYDDILEHLRKAEEAEGMQRRELLDQLPDAIFMVTTMPSFVARRLVEVADFRLVPLPFGEAFSMVSVEEETGDTDRIAQIHLQTTEIPKFTYGVSPPVPAEPCQTIGTRLLLVAHKDVAAEAVERLLPLVYVGPINKLYHPTPLDRMLPEYALHDGAIRYRDREKPIVRSEVADRLQRMLSVIGPLLGAGLALYGYLRWRRVLRFESYFHEVLRVKMMAKGIQIEEGVPMRPNERRTYLEEQLDELQSQAIADFSQGYFRGEGVVFNLMSLIRDTRESLKQLDAGVYRLEEKSVDEQETRRPTKMRRRWLHR